MPIMMPYGHAERAALRLLGITINIALPWSLIAPHEKQAQQNHQQTLARLRERGGLDASEAVAILEDRSYRAMDEAQAFSRLAELMRNHLESVK